MPRTAGYVGAVPAVPVLGTAAAAAVRGLLLLLGTASHAEAPVGAGRGLPAAQQSSLQETA
jgi:hypothetical protein